MQQFSKEELNNILALINMANITGKDAIPVAMLQQKINLMLGSINAPEEAKSEQKDNEVPN